MNDTDIKTGFLQRLRECRKQIIAAAIATVGSFGSGTVFGWSSVATKDWIKQNGEFGEMSENMISWVTSVAILGALFGGPLAGGAMDYMGRKTAIILFSVPFLLGWTTMCSAYFFRPNGFFLLYIGRFLTGICAGSFLVLIPTYIKEITSDVTHGVLGSVVPLMLVTGILYAFVIGAFLDWFKITLCCGITPFCLAVGMLFIPETPRYFVVNEKMDRAVTSFMWLVPDISAQAARQKLMELYPAVEVHACKSRSKIRGLLTRPVAFPILIMVPVIFFQQFGGVNAVTLYTNSIFSTAGGFIDPKIATILIGIVQVLFVILAMVLVDVVGRRILIISTSFIMGLCLIGFGVYLYLKEKGDGSEEAISWLPVVAICTYIAAYSCGVGTIPWVLATEIYNPDYRATSVAIGSFSYWIFGFVVAKIYNDMRSALNSSGCFWLFGGFCMAGSLFAAAFVPETKGKSNTEIIIYFGGKVPLNNSITHFESGDSNVIETVPTPSEDSPHDTQETENNEQQQINE